MVLKSPGGSAIGPDKGPGAGGMAVERVAARAAKAKNGGTQDVPRALERRAAGPSALGGAEHSRIRGRGG